MEDGLQGHGYRASPGNDDCGVRRRRPSFPWRREPIAGPPPWIPAVAGMTDVAAVDSRCCGNDDCGVRRRRPSFPWRREPIAGPPPWIPAVAGMTMWLPRCCGNDDCGVRRRRPSFPWRRESRIGGSPPGMSATLSPSGGVTQRSPFAGMTEVGMGGAGRVYLHPASNQNESRLEFSGHSLEIYEHLYSQWMQDLSTTGGRGS